MFEFSSWMLLPNHWISAITVNSVSGEGNQSKSEQIRKPFCRTDLLGNLYPNCDPEISLILISVLLKG